MGKTINRIITRFEELILSYSVILMAIILIGSIISRTLFNNSWTFAEEGGQFLILIVTFIGIGYGAKKARHITMSAVFDLLSEKYKKVFMLMISGGTSLAMFYIAYYAVLYTMKVQELGRVSPSMRIPMYLIIAVVPIGFFLGAIEYSRTFIKNLKAKEIYISSELTIYDLLVDESLRDAQVSTDMNNGEEK